MVFAFILSFIVLIFPIFLNVNIVFNFKYKKVFFALKIFGIIKILSGYIEISKNDVLIHISDKKAILIEFIDLDGVKKSFKPFMDYHFISLRTLTELGDNENRIIPFFSTFILNYIESILKWLLINRKPYVNFNNYYNIYESEDKKAFFGKALITLNFLMIIISVIKILVEKLTYEFRKIKQ